jgi:hypothetical protein
VFSNKKRVTSKKDVTLKNILLEIRTFKISERSDFERIAIVLC